MQEGPGVAEMMAILGKDAVIKRLRSSIDIQRKKAASKSVKKL